MDAFSSTNALALPDSRNWSDCQMGAPPRLSVVIVNYQSWEDTARLVQQLQQSAALYLGQAEIVIVDNNSLPHPLIGWLRRASGVSLRRWRSNKGFARAANEGCRLSQGEWILLLNPDTSVEVGFLDEVLERIDQQEADVGVMGFRLLNSDGSPQLSTGVYPQFLTSLARLLLPRHCRKYTRPQQSDACEVDWVTGCCLLARRTCLQQLGGLDSEFFLYYEDVDLCRRARAAGWSVWFDPTLSVIHHQPIHSRRVPAHIRLVTRHALLTYARKHWPEWQFRLLGVLIDLESRWRQGAAWWQGATRTSQIFGELQRLTGHLLSGHTRAARATLLEVIRDEEVHRARLHNNRHCSPQPTRSVSSLSGQRQPTSSTEHASAGGR